MTFEPTVLNCLAMFGGACAIVIGFSVIYAVLCCIKELLHKAKWRYKYKHRFDKPPTAACYCKDCKLHGDESHRCCKFDWNTADNWFCWDAEPKEHDPDVPK